MNSHARFAAHTARALGFVFRSMDGEDGYLFEVRTHDGVKSAVFAGGYATPYALNSARAYSLARDKDFANRVMRGREGLLTIPSRLFFTHARKAASRSPGRELGDALAFAETAAWPLFCKPNSGGRGQFAERIENAAAFRDYLTRVRDEFESILVQPVIEGDEHRVFVLEGRALFSYRKHAPAGGAANRSQGGGAADFTDAPPDALARTAMRAAEALDLKLAGVDLFDVSPARDLSELVVIEANANPGIETLADVGRFDLIETVWAANFRAALR
ncbi:MAG: RimK family alpha-L-glutamate ligase [Hyphomonadaceae bacterium]